MGFEGNVSQMDSATKAQATFQALLVKTTVMQGDAARTVGSSTNQMKAFSAAMSDLSIIVGQQILPILTPMITALTGVLTSFNQLSPSVQQFTVLAVAMIAVLGPLALLLSAISLPMVLIAAGAAAVFVAFQNWGDIVGFAKDVFNGVKTWMGDKMSALLDSVLGPINAVTDTFFNMWDKVVGNSFVPDMVEAIKSEFSTLGDVMVKPAEAATAKVTDAFRTMASEISSGLSAGLGAAGSQIGGSAGGLLGSFLGPVLGSLGGALGTKVGGFFSPTVPTVGKALGGPISKPTLVGERGPELFMPGRAGTIVSNSNMGGGAVTINQNINLMPDIGVRFKEQLAQAMPVIQSAAVQHWHYHILLVFQLELI
jgi:hypothetical protein